MESDAGYWSSDEPRFQRYCKVWRKSWSRTKINIVLFWNLFCLFTVILCKTCHFKTVFRKWIYVCGRTLFVTYYLLKDYKSMTKSLCRHRTKINIVFWNCICLFTIFMHDIPYVSKVHDQLSLSDVCHKSISTCFMVSTGRTFLINSYFDERFCVLYDCSAVLVFRKIVLLLDFHFTERK